MLELAIGMAVLLWTAALYDRFRSVERHEQRYASHVQGRDRRNA
jgi:hypothetical protein